MLGDRRPLGLRPQLRNPAGHASIADPRPFIPERGKGSSELIMSVVHSHEPATCFRRRPM